MEKSAAAGLSRGSIYSRRRVHRFLGDSSQRSNSKGHWVLVGPSVTSPGWRSCHRFRPRRRQLSLLQRDARHRHKAPLHLQNLTTVTVTARLSSPSRPTVTSPEARSCHRYSQTSVTVTARLPSPLRPTVTSPEDRSCHRYKPLSPLQPGICHRYTEPLQARVTVTARRLSPLHRAVTNHCHRYGHASVTVTQSRYKPV